MNTCVVDGGGGVERCVQVASDAGCEFTSCADDVGAGVTTLLVVKRNHVELRRVGDVRGKGVFVDFVSDAGRRRGLSKRQSLARAVGVSPRGRTVIDATAGLGSDAFSLARLGCHVTAIERSPIIAVLLQDGIRRADNVPALHDIVQERLRLVAADAICWLQGLDESSRPDVVFLDPMYGAPVAARSRVRKEMYLLRDVVGDDDDSRALLDAAMHAALERVVVKRMRHAPALGGEPTVTYRGSIVRYDVYLIGK